MDRYPFGPPANRILAAIPQSEFQRYFSALEPVLLEAKQVLYEPDDAVTHVYFIEDGIISTLTQMTNGTTIEARMAGFEGMIGIGAILGRPRARFQYLVQISGRAFRMPLVDCQVAFDGSKAVRSLILRYIDTVMEHGAQSAACNGLHTIEQRFARWLLMAHDRYRGNLLPMTHNSIASMLAVRRPGVTETAGRFQGAGWIRCGRGRIMILKRDQIEAAACECYQTDHDRFMLFQNLHPSRLTSD